MRSLTIRSFLVVLLAQIMLAQPQNGRVSLFVHFAPGADRGPVRAFAAQNGARVQYEYGILPNTVNLRDFPAGLANALQNIPGVVAVEPDMVATSFLTQSVSRIQALQSQISSYNVDGTGVRVCVIDGGIDAAHPMLAGRVDPGWDFANSDSNPADDTGHGTHVAAIVAGAAVSGYPQGVAPGARIIPVKALNNGSGSFSDVIAGIDYCAGTGVNGQGQLIPNAAQVINMSLGGGQFSGSCDTDAAAVASNNAVNRGLVVVAASGNNGFSSGMGTPACASKVIAVGATYDQNYSKNFSWCTASNGIFCTKSCTDSNPAADAIGCYSNKGSQLDVAAPGCEISSAQMGGGLRIMCGTSMAAPHVAGLAALLLQANPNLVPVDPGNGAPNVRNCIRNGADDKGASGFDASYGYGRINASNSLSLCSSAEPPPNQQPTANFTFNCTGLTCGFNASGSSDSDGTIASYAWNFGDGTSGSGVTPGKTYASGGSYTVTLTVTDDDGAQGSTSRQVTVTASNAAPTANFTFSCTGLTCGFTSTSTDTDGTITGYSWNFGDGTSGTGPAPAKTYAAGGTYTVTLTVTDDDGAQGSTSKPVTVTAPSSSITLSATGYKVKGIQRADLTWSGATASTVDIFRSGVLVINTANDGSHTDNINRKGGGTYQYQVCNAGTTTCSNTVTVVF